MVKHRALPMKAMIESKAGNTIEMARNIKIVTTRMAIFITPLKYADLPTMADAVSEMACWCTPNRTSAVEIMGLAFRGTLVSGIIAMTPHSRYVRARGYPAVRRMFEVMASKTSSPNMSRPATAAVMSRRYVKEKVILSARVYLCGCLMSR